MNNIVICENGCRGECKSIGGNCPYKKHLKKAQEYIKNTPLYKMIYLANNK